MKQLGFPLDIQSLS